MKTNKTDQIHYIACNLCEAICGLEIKLENGQVKSIRGDKLDPVSKGHICPKAVALQDIYNDPDRLRRPIRKTADGWQEISWPEAYDEVTSELKRIQSQYGNDAVAVYLGNPTVHNLEALLFGPVFLRTLKTKNRYSATSVDQLPEQLVSLLMFGHSLLIPLPDLDRTGFHLIFGANPVVSNGSMMTAPGVAKRLKAIRERGGQLVVVDPRRTETADIADLHLFIQPGSDVLMLLAMLHVVFNEELQTLGSVAQFTKGVEIIEEIVRGYPPEKVAPFTGVEPETLKTLVREFCAAGSASCYGRIGVSTQQFGTLTQWLITVFNIVTGNLDIPGGTQFSKPAFEVLTAVKPGKKGFADKLSRVRKLPDFSGEFPVATLAEEITTPGEGQVRALVTSAGNPVLSTPNGHQLDAAMSKLDYMVSIDIYLNETTRHANIILPPLTGLERPHYDVVFQALAIRNGAKFSEPVFKADKDRRSDLQIFTELGWRMQSVNGFSKAAGWFKKKLLQQLGSEWIINRRLKQGPYYKSLGLDLKKLKDNPHGIDLGPMQSCLPERLFTADKTIHLAPDEFVSELKKLTVFFDADATHSGQPGFDLQLIGRRDPRTNNSWLHNSYRMVKGKNRCLALVHPHDAKRRQLLDGDIARVSSRVGSIRIPVAISDEMKPGVISIPHGWGHQVDGIKLGIAQQHAGVNTNILSDDLFLDSLSGNAALNGIPVSLEKDATQELNI
ncbi:MAG: molybdopterin-dependent oxidoreductase [Xanthomonadales bacterium]|nr:molybdopterin-dependent oxidoreductase [Xanthomonadales bacterium]